MIYRSTALALTLFLARPALAQSAVTLANTDLYTKVAYGCQTIPLSEWHHPDRKVLESKRATIDRVELCNDRKFPIFTVQLKYDPRTSENQTFYDDFFLKLTKTNGWWSYALVDETDDLVFTVITDKADHSFKIYTQSYSAPS